MATFIGCKRQVQIPFHAAEKRKKFAPNVEDNQEFVKHK
jgi:hypothetical protein